MKLQERLEHDKGEGKKDRSGKVARGSIHDRLNTNKATARANDALSPNRENVRSAENSL